MKRVISLLLFFWVLALPTLILCGCVPMGLIYQEYPNCAVFTFEDFGAGETASITLARTGLDDGAIYYQANLTQGALSVKYKDAGIINDPQMLAEFSADEKMPIGGSGGYVYSDTVEIIFESFSPISGEIILAFTEDAIKAVHADKYLHEHTYETYWDASGHGRFYTCGCDLPDEKEAHMDGDENGACDICQYFMGMIFEPENVFLHEYESWLLDLTAEDVAEIKNVFEGIGIAPGSLKTIKRTTDKAVIADVIEKYSFATMTSMPFGQAHIMGGSGFTIDFILTDGTVKTLRFNNYNYAYKLSENTRPSLYFKMDLIPSLESEPYDNVQYLCGFISYAAWGTVYSGGELLGKVPMEEIEFVVLEKDPDVPETEMYTVETSFGDLIFYTDTVFCVGENRDVKYQLAHTNLLQLLGEHTVNPKEIEFFS
jgi:hypothetical protein